MTVVGVEILGEWILPSRTSFGGTEIGGLSSITYDDGRGVYYALSDDQGDRETGDPVRYYTLTIEPSDGSFNEAGLTFLGVSQLWDDAKSAFAPGGVDPEGFTISRGGSFFLSSEGDLDGDPIVDPFIRRYNPSGTPTAELPIPDHYIPDGTDRGVRFNLSFESLNLTPDGRRLVTAAEGALSQDGPASAFGIGSLARILEYDLSHRSPVAEYVYEVGPWAEPSDIFGVNGIVEVLPIDNVGTMLVMERSFSVGGVGGNGTGNVVVLKQISTAGATNVLDVDALYDGGSPIAFTPVSQSEVFAFDDTRVPVDNLEGMTFGPMLPDGRRTLVIISDNNFSSAQFTQFFVLAVDIQPAS
ncbi:esterase-like activity of phytase family protein [Agromyces sp. SYSU T00194]|uniref:esterase-like activity of phytase family protein n=1 Tax=Agromyces chitinivorans TaxID=3158560 RepID=UPI0033960EA4